MNLGTTKKWLIFLSIGAIDLILAIIGIVLLNDLNGFWLSAFMLEMVAALIVGAILLNRHAKDVVAYYFQVKKGENITLEESSAFLLFLLGFFLAMPGPLSFLGSLVLLIPPWSKKIALFLTARHTRADRVIIEASLENSAST